MNRICLINGSPKFKDSASEAYLDLIYNNLDKNYLINEVDCLNFDSNKLEVITNSDILIIAFPLYIDALPSHFLRFLIWLEENNISNKQVYTIINCGYYEGIQNKEAMNVIKNYCDKINSKFMGGIGIGCGPIAYKNHFYNKNVLTKLKRLSEKINYQSDYNIVFVQPLIPRFIYIFLANILWYKQIKMTKKADV